MGTSKLSYYKTRLKGNLSDEACQKLEFIREAFTSGQAIQGLEGFLYSLTPEQVDAVKATRTSCPVEDRPQGTLRPYQTVGVAFMYYSQSCLLGDSVGLGKTAQIAGLYNLLAQFSTSDRPPRVLFFGDRVATPHLRDELIMFTGEYVHHSWSTTKSIEDLVMEYAEEPVNLVIPHAALRNQLFQAWFETQYANTGKFPYDLVVVDESSVLGNSTTQIYKAAKTLFKDCPRLILLNATPFEADLDTFYNQLNLLDPTFLPTKTSFNNTYRSMDYTGIFPKFTGKYKNAERFQHLVSLRYLPRTREQLGASFQDCSADLVLVPLSDEQKALLKDTYLHRAVYDCPWVLDSSIDTCGKVDATVNLVGEILSTGAKQVLIYSHFKDAQDVLMEAIEFAGYSCHVLNGDTNSTDSRDIVKSFQSGNTQVLITNVQKSLNFDNVNHCIFYGYNPNPNKMRQFEGRITRSFDVRDKHIYMILTEGKEFETFKHTVLSRADASKDFAGSDFSMVITLLSEQISSME